MFAKEFKLKYLVLLITVSTTWLSSGQHFLKKTNGSIDSRFTYINNAITINENSKYFDKEFHVFWTDLNQLLNWCKVDFTLHYALYEDPVETNVFVLIEEHSSTIYFEKEFFVRSGPKDLAGLWRLMNATLHELGHVFLKKHRQHELNDFKLSELQADFIAAFLYKMGGYSKHLEQEDAKSLKEIVTSDYYDEIGNDNPLDHFHHGSRGERAFISALGELIPASYIGDSKTETFDFSRIVQLSKQVLEKYTNRNNEDRRFELVNPQTIFGIERQHQKLVNFCFDLVSEWHLDEIKEYQFKGDDTSFLFELGTRGALIGLDGLRLDLYIYKEEYKELLKRMLNRSKIQYGQILSLKPEGRQGFYRANLASGLCGILGQTRNFEYAMKIHVKECDANPQYPCEKTTRILRFYKNRIDFDTIFRSYRGWVPYNSKSKEDTFNKYRHFKERFHQLDNHTSAKFHLGVWLSTDISLIQDPQKAWQLIKETEILLQNKNEWPFPIDNGELGMFYLLKARISTRQKDFQYADYLRNREMARALLGKKYGIDSQSFTLFYPSSYFALPEGFLNQANRTEYCKYLEFVKRRKEQLDQDQKAKALLEEAYVLYMLGLKNQALVVLEQTKEFGEIYRPEVLIEVAKFKKVLGE